MSKHWNPDKGGGRGQPTADSGRWLSPEAYRALSPQQKRELFFLRRQYRRGQKQGHTIVNIALVGVLVASAWVHTFGLPAWINPAAQPPSAPVVAHFDYCKWGGGTNCVVDGDTFYLNGAKVRIAGIDAPETHDYRCQSELELGERAARQLQALLNSGAVTMTGIDRDRDVYGRLLRNVSVNGQHVGEALMSGGVARAYAGGRRPWC